MERLFGCDDKKRARLLDERGFDLLDMAEVLTDPARLDVVDQRFDDGQERRVTIGSAAGRILTCVYTMRGAVTWLIAAWPANRKERLAL